MSNHNSQPYLDKIAVIHHALGISPSYATDRALPLQVETDTLKEAEVDEQGKSHHLCPRAADAWLQLKQAAHNDGVDLIIVSGYRSMEYQRNLILQKLNRGKSLDEVLSLLAAPGYSEHHTGRAIDLTSPDCSPCIELFELTTAFRWLEQNAAHFHFSLSYPRHNRYGFVYEPWHWSYNSEQNV